MISWHSPLRNKSMNKKCPKCGEKKVQKWGKKLGRQNYKCNGCRYSFLNKKRNKGEKKEKNSTSYMQGEDIH